ncbi:MAG: hypothetical protein ABSD47_11750 [Candidatus Methylomirabilota bacterium]|jgi:uncharacterized protein (UPF0332 family)
MTDGPAEAIRAEVGRGEEARRAAAVLRREGLYRDAMSRASSAALHDARARRLLKDEAPKTHAGGVRRLRVYCVRTGV